MDSSVRSAPSEGMPGCHYPVFSDAHAVALPRFGVTVRRGERYKDDDLELPESRRIVELAAAGDHDAWEKIYRHVYPRLRSYAARQVGADGADDVVNETMTRAVAGIGGFRWEPAGIDPWLFGIARRVAVDHHRKVGRARRLNRAASSPAGDAQPGDAVELADEHAAVRAAFDQLTPSERELLELRVVAGLSAEQSAAVLGKRAGAVRVAQSRALSRLRHILDSDHD